RNALDDTVMDALVDVLEVAQQDDDVRAVLLTGAGGHFCGGADIIARNRESDRKPRTGSIQRRLPMQAHRLVMLMASVQLPIVAAVRGIAAGIGFQLALLADFAVVSQSARFIEPYVQRGFTPDTGATWLLPRRVGHTRAMELLVLGRELSGTEAAEWGLVHAAVADDELDATVEDLLARLATAPTVGLGLTKWLVHAGGGLDLERHLANEALAMELSSRSQDFREGLSAFRDKRPPHFEGL
ncbi:MAG: enoyl-CoA hydratase/isomerase family protein, partial [Acidimicrobiia bacterium]